MSGTKSITITDGEYARYRAAETQLQIVHQNLPEVLAGVRRQAATDLQQRVEPLERRQQQFQTSLSEMSASIQAVERQTSSRMEAQYRDFREELACLDQQSRSDFDEGLQAQERRLLELLNEEAQSRRTMGKQLHKQVGKVRSRVAALEDSEAERSLLAQASINAAQIIQEQIATQSRHTQFTPGELSAETERLGTARAHLAAGMSQAAYALAEDVYESVSRLRQRLDDLEYEWHVSWAAARMSAQVFAVRAEASFLCEITDPHTGDAPAEQLDTDYWAEGGVAAVLTEVQTLVANLEREPLDLSADDLKGIVLEVVPGLENRLEHTLKEAQLNFFYARARKELAQRIVVAFKEQGYAPQEYVFVDDDYRNASALKFKNLLGTEVVTIIEPTAESGEGSDLQILSYDDGFVTDHLREQRANSLARSLRSQGVAVGDVVRGSDEPDPESKDLTNIRNRPGRKPYPAKAQPAAGVSPGVPEEASLSVGRTV